MRTGMIGLRIIMRTPMIGMRIIMRTGMTGLRIRRGKDLIMDWHEPVCNSTEYMPKGGDVGTVLSSIPSYRTTRARYRLTRSCSNGSFFSLDCNARIACRSVMFEPVVCNSVEYRLNW